MVKQKKKRNKKYQGADAKTVQPTIVRVSAEERTAFREWWLTYGKLLRFASIAIIVLALVIILFIGLIDLLNG